MMKTLSIILSITLIGCSIIHPKLMRLTGDEFSVIQSAIRYELDNSNVDERRPIVLLDRTETWLPVEPTEEEISRYPEDVRKERQDPNNLRNISPAFRENNKKHFSILGFTPVKPIVLYQASLFDRQYRNSSCCKELIKRFGKEPYVFSTSRPYFNSKGEAIVLLTSQATWSGCGGMNIYRIVRKQEDWVVQDWDLLMFW